MILTSLIDNTRLNNRTDLAIERGLSIHASSMGQSILFDAGSSEAFCDNATLLNVDINKMQREINKIKQNLEKLDQKEIKRSVIEKYQKIDRKMETELRDLKAAEKILTQNEKGYKSIKKSLSKALISKKQRI